MFLRIYRIWIRFRGRCITALSAGSFLRFGKGSRLRFPLRIEGSKRVAVGEGVFLGPNCWIEVVGSEIGGGAAIEVGDGTAIAGFCTITAARSVVIERDVLIARYVYISDHSHEYFRPDVPIIAQGIRRVAPVVIKEGAWLGQGAVICPGVVVGRNSVVGANSVVRESVPDRCVVAGAPAKIIRRIDGPESK
ncbi:MAG: acyltransferase [Verrucomicrobiae bacterium]|nr:acyltransferase [Verrucomicrobiae bacterium]